MAWILTSYIIDPGDRTIKVSHNFYGLNKEEAQTYFNEHLSSCEYFKAAHDEGRTFEEWDQVPQSDLPVAEEEAGEDEEEEDEEGG